MSTNIQSNVSKLPNELPPANLIAMELGGGLVPASNAQVKERLNQTLQSLTKGSITNIDQLPDYYKPSARFRTLSDKLNKEAEAASGGRVSNWTQLLSPPALQVLRAREASTSATQVKPADTSKVWLDPLDRDIGLTTNNSGPQRPNDPLAKRVIANGGSPAALQSLKAAGVPLNSGNGRLPLPNTREGGRALANAVAASEGPFGDPLARLSQVNIGKLAQEYGLSRQFVQGFEEVKRDLTISTAISTAQTLASGAGQRTQRPKNNPGGNTGGTQTGQTGTANGSGPSSNPRTIEMKKNPDGSYTANPNSLRPGTPGPQKMLPPARGLPQANQQLRTYLNNASTFRDVVNVQVPNRGAGGEPLKLTSNLPSAELKTLKEIWDNPTRRANFQAGKFENQNQASIHDKMVNQVLAAQNTRPGHELKVITIQSPKDASKFTTYQVEAIRSGYLTQQERQETFTALLNQSPLYKEKLGAKNWEDVERLSHGSNPNSVVLRLRNVDGQGGMATTVIDDLGRIGGKKVAYLGGVSNPAGIKGGGVAIVTAASDIAKSMGYDSMVGIAFDIQGAGGSNSTKGTLWNTRNKIQELAPKDRKTSEYGPQSEPGRDGAFYRNLPVRPGDTQWSLSRNLDFMKEVTGQYNSLFNFKELSNGKVPDDKIWGVLMQKNFVPDPTTPAQLRNLQQRDPQLYSIPGTTPPRSLPPSTPPRL
jgi:hypothetical protein